MQIMHFIGILYAQKMMPSETLFQVQRSKFLCRKDTKLDERAAWLQRLKTLPAARTLPLLYPRLYALGDLLREVKSSQEAVRLPPPILSLSAAKLADDGIFLLENGFEAYLHFGDRVGPDLLMALIG